MPTLKQNRERQSELNNSGKNPCLVPLRSSVSTYSSSSGLFKTFIQIKRVINGGVNI